MTLVLWMLKAEILIYMVAFVVNVQNEVMNRLQCYSTLSQFFIHTKIAGLFNVFQQKIEYFRCGYRFISCILYLLWPEARRIRTQGKIDVINKMNNMDHLHRNVNVPFLITCHLIMLGLGS